MSKKQWLKTFGIDINKETLETLFEAGQKFAKELNCPVEQVQVRIYYNPDGSPYFYLYRFHEGKNENIRQAELDEIL